MGPLTADGGSPPGAPTVRTLSVMFSDVKDYTARAARESRLGILDLVRRHRDLAAPIVKRRGGRIVKSLGDGLLITFESATDAVLAGLEIQAAAASHSKSAFAERDKLELRIAVSTGEVAQEHGDVFGETVNLASRAQQHAAPGEVVFTEVTWATINRREVPAADAGTFELKGIDGPVRLYRAMSQVDPVPSRDA
jgi:adenylate cyclase